MSAAVLAGALMLDAALGEPRWLWQRVAHPAVVMGRAIRWCDQRLNQGRAPFWAGAICIIGLVLLAGLVGVILSAGGPVIEAAGKPAQCLTRLNRSSSTAATSSPSISNAAEESP